MTPAPGRKARKGEEGFATVTAVTLCAGLAVVAVALVNLGLASMRRVDNDIERETERQVLRSAIAETAADLVDDPSLGLGVVVREYGDLKVEVLVANELAKASVYQASEAQLTQALENLADVDAADLTAKLTAVRLEGEASQLSLDALLAKADLAPQEEACLREKLTVHASSVDPFAIAGETPPAKDAGIVNLRARIVAGRPLDLTREAIVAITGDLQSPLLVLDERTFRSSSIQGCFDETA